jgi:hypothetical protein
MERQSPQPVRQLGVDDATACLRAPVWIEQAQHAPRLGGELEIAGMLDSPIGPGSRKRDVRELGGGQVGANAPEIKYRL